MCMSPYNSHSCTKLYIIVNCFYKTIHSDKEFVIFLRWTGSNTNPNNNAGQGKAGTDRSNIVLLKDTTYTEGTRDTNGQKIGHFARSFPTHLDEQNGTYTFLGWDRESRESLALLGPS